MTRTVHDRIAANGTLLNSATALLSVLDRVPRRLVPAAPHYRAIGVGNSGVGHLWRGELTDAEIKLTAAAAQNRELGSTLAYLSMQTYLSVLAVIHGRYHDAEKRAAAVQEVVDRRGWANEPHVLGLFVTRGMAHLAHHRLDAAADTVAAGLAASTKISDTSCRLALGIAAVGIATARGDQQAARVATARLLVERERVADLPDLLARWCAVAQGNSLLTCGAPTDVLDLIAAPAETSGFAPAMERVVLAKAHFALGQSVQVRAQLEPLIKAESESGISFLWAAVDTRILLALAAARENRDSAALRLMTEAIDLAEPEDLLQPFLDAGPPAAALVAQHRHVRASHLDFTAQLLSDTSGQRQPLVLPTTEHLTERELIVLRYLPTMLKAAEIADDLFVTVNTVKSHLRAIYRKLDVTTRREAVERARAVNLL